MMTKHWPLIALWACAAGIFILTAYRMIHPLGAE